MFDIATTFMVQLVDLMIPVFGIYILFDLIGGLFFGRKWD